MNNKKIKTVYTVFCAMIMGVLLTPAAYAAGPVEVVSNLTTVMFDLTRAAGIIILLWGIVQVGMSIQSHDAGQRSQGFLVLAGGAIICFAKEILNMIAGV